MQAKLKSIYHLFLERINRPQFKYRAGWTAIFFFICALLYASIANEYQNKKYTRGTTCTRQLADIDRGLLTLCEKQNIHNTAELSEAVGAAPYLGLDPYLFGYKINGPAGNSSSLRCPVGGTYVVPATFNATERLPDDPTCSLATSDPSAYRGTYLHTLKARP